MKAILFLLISAISHPQQYDTTAAIPSVEGDIYLVTKSGDVKKAAANTVYLLKSSAKLSRDLDDACVANQRANVDTTRIALDESIYKFGNYSDRSLEHQIDSLNLVAPQHRAKADTLMAVVAAEILNSNLRTSPTRMDAHYRFQGVEPGEYILFAETTLGDYRYQWWKKVVVKAGQLLVADLDNSSVIENPYCFKP